jgi:transposase
MQNICGVDISRSWLDAWVAPDHHQRFANTPEGVEALAAFCREHEAGLVAMEASGGYERPAFLALWKLGQPCAIASPAAVRHFARAMGYLEKTDRIDAQIIAGFAVAKHMKPTPPPSTDQQRLTATTARLRQLTADLSIQKQRLHTAHDPLARESLNQTIAFFNGQIETIARAIAELIDADPLWTALDRTIRSIKGLSDRTVAILLAELPEIGTLSNKAIAKLVGLAPIANDSGARNGQRSIRGGRAPVRSILFLVANVARRFDHRLQDFCNRLLEKGKPKMVVRIALARKVLVWLNARTRQTREEISISH